jgi:osmotically-inducible protein OsmY
MPQIDRMSYLLPSQRQETAPAKAARVVQATALSRLRTSGYAQLQLISCEFHEGVLTLRGHVSSFYLKQLAQTLVRGVDRVEEIKNRLEVASQRDSP